MEELEWDIKLLEWDLILGKVFIPYGDPQKASNFRKGWHIRQNKLLVPSWVPVIFDGESAQLCLRMGVLIVNRFRPSDFNIH